MADNVFPLVPDADSSERSQLAALAQEIAEAINRAITATDPMFTNKSVRRRLLTKWAEVAGMFGGYAIWLREPGSLGRRDAEVAIVRLARELADTLNYSGADGVVGDESMPQRRHHLRSDAVKGRPYVSISIRTAVEGLKGDMYLSPDVIDELAAGMAAPLRYRHGPLASFRDEDTAIIVRYPGEPSYRLYSLVLWEGADSYEGSEPPEFDDTTKGPVK